MTQNAAAESSIKSAGYGNQKACATDEASQEVSVKEPVYSPGLNEASVVREFLEEERAAKLADLRAQKAKLLEAKARATKLMEEKQRQANLAYLEDGKQRGLKGFALVEHAAKLADTMKERDGKAEEATEDKVGALVVDSHSQDDNEEGSRVHVTENHTHEDSKQLVGDAKFMASQQAAKFMASHREKAKNVNRKGHHGRGSVKHHLATGRA